MTTPALRCTGLVKQYEDVRAVDGLDLSVRRGECLGMLGPNGAGKTTSVEVFEGLLRADAGEVEVLGRRWGTRSDVELRERIGIQLQETQLADKLTVAETLRLFRSFYRKGRAVAEVIGLAGLEEKRDVRVFKLSGGQRQRLALACALVGDPELLFLDEPTTGLDPQARLRVWEAVELFRAAGGTVVLTTHYMEEAARLCDRVVIMDRGRIIAEGSPDELIESLDAEQIVELRLDGAIDEDDLRALPGVLRVTHRNGHLGLAVSGIGETLPALLQLIEARGETLEALTTRQPTLEDVFVRLTGKGLRDGA